MAPAPNARTATRDVFFATVRDPTTNLDIVLVISSTYVLQTEDGKPLPKDSKPLRRGRYLVATEGSVQLNNELIVTRTISMGTGTRIASFAAGVRARDRGCVVTGQKVPEVRIELDDWTGYQAAHIFPLSHEHLWKQFDFGRWITLFPPSGDEINSIQNGILLRSDIHQLFDMYSFSINPDDNNKVVFFRETEGDLSGKHVQFPPDSRRPAPELLQWHFRQAVLHNMKGAGEPIFEHDFPPGSDMMGGILSGPKAAERMEAELFGRLARTRVQDDEDRTTEEAGVSMEGSV